MGNYTRDFELLRATTSTGAGTPTNVTSGYGWIHFQTYGFNIAAAAATSSQIRPEVTLDGTNWVLCTVTDLANNTATSTVATSSVFRLGDIGGITGFRLRVATFNGAASASLTAVGRAFGW